MRTFFSIEFDNELKEEITALQNKLRQHTYRGRWKYKDNFHITLKFLGDIEHKDISCILDNVEDLSEIKSFSLSIDKLGYFMGKNNIRVLWLGLGGEIELLKNLKNSIDKRLVQSGFEIEKRKFTPHITIAQDIISETDFDNLIKIFNNYDFPKINVKAFNLMLSEQIGNKRIYSVLNTIKLS
jgi:2'-5' RNA ligase